jgi:hypothetical protein
VGRAGGIDASAACPSVVGRRRRRRGEGVVVETEWRTCRGGGGGLERGKVNMIVMKSYTDTHTHT